MEDYKKSNVVAGLSWKLLERFGVQGIQFILQLILARLLDPEHYGVLSLMVIFTTLANVFIQSGFSTALIQNRSVTQEDYSSVFWFSSVIALFLYGLLFFLAPYIGMFYRMPGIVTPFRVLALILIPGALNSIQLAKVSREMNFKQVFISNIGSIILSGMTGIILAYIGAGIWALVAQSLLSTVVACFVMWFTVDWHPKWICNFTRIKILFSFGWKLLISSLLETAYQDLRSLVIGKKYNAVMLGYYNRGKQFPQFIINGINGAVQSVMLPAMSERQDENNQIKELMRNSIMVSSYLIFPMMSGLAAISPLLIRLLLTDKWLPCVPFMQIYCFTLAFYPVHSCNLQAINAVGRSDIFLKLEIIKKIIGILALVIAVFCFDSAIAIALTGVFTTIVSTFINAYPNQKLIGYSYTEQLKDIGPSFFASLAMCFFVLLIPDFFRNLLIRVLIKIVFGVFFYLYLSVAFKIKPYKLLLDFGKSYLKKRRENK